MSEYMEKFAVSRLIGAPPGYVGYEEGGQLTEKVRRKPYSVILLDEVEKAHPDIFNMLLQVLDEGSLTDSLGRKVDFKNTVIIMTSNLGARQVKDFGNGVGFGYEIKISSKALNFLCDKGFDKKYGARPLKRAIQNYVEDLIAEEIVKSNIKEGNKFKIDCNKNNTELNSTNYVFIFK